MKVIRILFFFSVFSSFLIGMKVFGAPEDLEDSEKVSSSKKSHEESFLLKHSGTEEKYPMSGVIIKIFVKEGDIVAKNTPLFILEAMKMELMYCAKSSGVIRNIKGKLNNYINCDEVFSIIYPIFSEPTFSSPGEITSLEKEENASLDSVVEENFKEKKFSEFQDFSNPQESEIKSLLYRAKIKESFSKDGDHVEEVSLLFPVRRGMGASFDQTVSVVSGVLQCSRENIWDGFVESKEVLFKVFPGGGGNFPGDSSGVSSMENSENSFFSLKIEGIPFLSSLDSFRLEELFFQKALIFLTDTALQEGASVFSQKKGEYFQIGSSLDSIEKKKRDHSNFKNSQMKKVSSSFLCEENGDELIQDHKNIFSLFSFGEMIFFYLLARITVLSFFKAERILKKRRNRIIFFGTLRKVFFSKSISLNQSIFLGRILKF